MRRSLATVAMLLVASTCLPANAAPARAKWTAADKTAARHAARHAAHRVSGRDDRPGWPPTVRKVAAIITSGHLGAGNTGHPCGSGKHAIITLIGHFPVAVSPPPGSSDTKVHGVVVTTKLGSHQICQISVKTGKVRPAPDSLVLFSR